VVLIFYPQRAISPETWQKLFSTTSGPYWSSLPRNCVESYAFL